MRNYPYIHAAEVDIAKEILDELEDFVTEKIDEDEEYTVHVILYKIKKMKERFGLA